MRAIEFINESRTGSLLPDIASALPATFVLPELKNQDAYLQYRFGVALAAARGTRDREKEGLAPFETTSAWGENQVVVSYDPDVEQLIDDALRMMGKSKKIRISTPTSEEAKDVDTTSIIPQGKKA